MKLKIGALLACLLAVGTAQAAPQATSNQNAITPVPLIIGKIPTPTIDGKVQPAEWKAAGIIPAFAENSKGKAPKAATKAYIGYDDKCFYVAAICSEPMMNKAVQNKVSVRDGGIYTNECIEVYLNPSADKISFYHFIADILGQKFDALGHDPYGYNPEWTTAAFKGDKYWSVEIAIPFSAINTKTPKPGDMWYGLIGRERQAVTELSASKPTFGAFDAIGLYGAWVFDSLKTNLQKQAGQLQLASKKWPAGMASDSAPWLKHLQSFQTKLSGMDEKAVRASYSKLAADVVTLQKEVAPLKIKAARISAGGQSILITKAYPYQPFSAGQIAEGEKAGPVDLTMLQDEWIDLAYNISNLSDSPITLRCTTRHGNPDGDFAFLGLRSVDTLWQQAYPVAAGDGEKVYDAVVPTTAGTVEIPAGATSQVWLSVHAPKSYSGNTEGQIVIQAVDGSPVDMIRLPIKINVIPVQLTAKPRLEMFTWDAILYPPAQYPDLARAFYTDLKGHGVTMAMMSCWRVLPRVKANPDGTITQPLDFTKVDNLIAATSGIIDKYYLTLDMWETDWLRDDLIGLEWNTPAYEKGFKTWWAAILNHLKSKGITTDDFIVNPVDESSDQRFVTLAHWVKEVDPSVQTVIDSHGGDILRETRKPTYTADIWMPHFTQFFDESYKQNIEIVRESKVPLWMYYYSESGNEKRMDPTSRYLSKFWWAFDNDVTGVGYWAQQLYGDPWYRKGSPNSYDTSLTYPTETGMVPSRRWQAWRQGWQDYTLLAIAREKMQKTGDTAGLATLNQSVKDTLANGIDPMKTDAVRTWLKDKIAQ